MVAYSDLVGFSIAALTMQVIAGWYVFRIRKFIGKRAYYLLGAINAVSICTDIMITYGLAVSAGRAGQQPLEALGIWIAFAAPFTLAVLHLLLQYGMAKGLLGSILTPTKDQRIQEVARESDTEDAKRLVGSIASQTEEQRQKSDLDRDIERDSKRDIPRDIDRDIERDKRR